MLPRFNDPRLVVAVVLAALCPTVAGAAAFQILEQSPKRLGTAYAGAATIGQDAATVFWNPAAMTQLDERQLSLGLTLISLRADFNDSGQTTATGPEGEIGTVSPVPVVYYVEPLGERWRLGIGINAPYGLVTGYDNDWRGRYLATDSALRVINFNATLAYALTDRLSVAAGLDLQYITATLERAIDSHAACLAAAQTAVERIVGSPLADLIPGDIVPSTLCAGNPAPGTRSADSSVKVEGDDIGLAYDLSLLYELGQHTRIGFVYRSGAEFTLEGQAHFDKDGACTSPQISLLPGASLCSRALSTVEGPIKAKVELPDVFILGVSHDLTPSWTLHGSIIHTQWSSIQKIEVINTDNGRSLSSLELKYEDVLRYAAGATFDPAGPHTWRFGFSYDETPQTDPEFVTARLPDGDRLWVTLGYSYAFSDDVSMDIGYAHIFVNDVKINRVTRSGKRLKGTYEGAADLLGVQLNWKF